MKKYRGFTLIELMIVVAIIAILAAIAIPNFLSFISKARISEVKSNLEAIASAELSYFGEKDRYSNSFVEIRWVPVGVAYYTYSVGTDYLGKDNNVNPKPAIATPAANDNSFTAYGWGNIDSDSTVDIWHIDHLKNMANDVDDIHS